MPVESTVQFAAISQQRFRKIDYAAMGAAFAIHNELGRLLNESIYQEAFRQKCESSELSSLREVEITVGHKSFSKKYYLDLVIDNGAIYEIKTASAISSAHESQLLNYLLLCNLSHGKLINFRGRSVESRYVSTTLTRADRSCFEINRSRWYTQTEYCDRIPLLLKDLLTDLGTHLDISLYREALHHLIADAEIRFEPVEVHCGSVCVGHQSQYLLNNDTALHLSALRSGMKPYQKQLLCLLTNTQLSSIQWINFGTSEILCTTLRK